MDILFKRGTTVQNNGYTGPSGSVSIDLEAKKLRIHDGTTVGGIIVGGDASTLDGYLPSYFTNASNLSDGIVPSARLSGSYSISITGSAATLTTSRTINGTAFNGSANITTTSWGTSRTLSFTGDVTGSAAVNGSANVAFAMTLANSGVTAGTYPKVTVDAKGRVTAGAALAAADIPSLDASKVTSGTFAAARIPTLNQNTTGSAATLTTARTLAATGDATWSVSFNGSANVSAALTLSDTGVSAGTYPKVTVDTKGRVTAGTSLTSSDIPALDASKITTGVLAAARIPTLNQSTTGNAATATKLATARNIQLSGDVSGEAWFDGSGDINIPLVYKNSGVTPGTHTKVTVDAKGNVTAGTSLTEADIPSLDASKITNGEIAVPVALGGGDTFRVSASPGSPSLPDYNVFGLAMYKSDSNVTGAIVFSAPMAIDDVMHQFEIDAYSYTPNKVEKILVGGLSYGEGWLSTTKMAFGSMDIQVRLGVDASGKSCIILGDVTTAWSFPQVAISRALLTHSGVTTAYTKGWTAALVTDLSGFSGLTGFLPNDTAAINTSGNAATATRLTTARTINGTLFNGNANITTTSWGRSRTIYFAGDVTGSGAIDGSTNFQFDLTLANSGVTAGQYSKVTVDAKGRVTGGTSLVAADIPVLDAAKITTGTISASRLPAEALIGDTTYSAGDGLSLSGTVFSIAPATASVLGGVKLGSATAQTVAPNAVTATASRSYAVQMNASQQLVVNVPWTNTTYSEITEAEITTGTASTARAISARRLTFALAGKANASHTHDYLPLAGGTLTGAITFAAGQTWPTFNQNTTGNAATATTLATARTINGTAFDGSANITTSLWGTTRTLSFTGDVTGSAGVNGGSNVAFAMTLANSGVNAGEYTKVTVDAKGRVIAGTLMTAADVGLENVNNTPDMDKNVLSATKLTTARTINGVSFNGTSNITVADATKLPLAGGTMTGAITFAAGQTWPTFNQSTTGNAGTATKLGTARTLTIGDTGKSFDGSANVTWTLGEIGAAAASHSHDYLPLSGGTLSGLLATKLTGHSVGHSGGDGSFSVRGDVNNAAVMSFHRSGAYAINMGLDTDNVFRLGGWSNGTNVYRLQSDGSGNLTASGNVTAYSDIRLKTDIQAIPDALAKVCALRGVTYERLDSGERQTGVIAQEVEAVLPEAVQDTGDYLSVAYGNMVGLLIEAIKELRAEVNELKERV